MGYGSDICTGGTATDSHHYSSFDASKLFDDNASTYMDLYPGTYPGEWIKYDLGEGVSKIAAQYTITNNAAGRGTYLQAWNFQGSNNNTDWTTIDSQTGQSFADSEKKTFNSFSNATAYRYYRWYIILANTNDLMLSEIEIMESTESTAAAANYLCSVGRDRMRSKGISLGAKVAADMNPSFLIMRHNRLRVLGISNEDAAIFTNLVTTFGPVAPGAHADGQAGYLNRVWIPASLISTSGSKIRVTLQENTGIAYKIADLYVGHKAASGDNYDFDGNQVRVTFNGGGTGCSVNASETKVSDEIVFALDETKDLILSYYGTDTSFDDWPYTNGVTTKVYYMSGHTSDVATSDMSGMTTINNQDMLIKTIEVIN